MPVITIKGHEFELDVMDADTADVLYPALDKVQKDMAQAKTKNMPVGDSIRFQCRSVFECFNTVLGKGADKKIFGSKCNLVEVMEAFQELSEAIVAQKSSFEDMTNKAIEKYLPNRAQRRAAAKTK